MSYLLFPQIPLHLLRMLHWVLFENPTGLSLYSVKKEEFLRIVNLPNGDGDRKRPQHMPTHIFR